MSKRIVGQVGKLKASKVGEYIQLHSHVWEEVLQTIADCHISHYSIFLHGDYVFSYYEYDGGDYEADMKRMEQDPVTQQWWTYTHPCFESYAMGEGAEYCADMEQIFHYLT